MKIRLIKENDWKDILNIQQQAYTDIEPESETVLRRKHIISPETCIVAVNNHEQVVGCCLAHPWRPDNSPPLHEVIGEPGSTSNLFIHDMAILPQSRRQGVASSLGNTVISLAKNLGFKSMTLVSVQNSEHFWNRFGFLKNSKIKISRTYGEGAIFMELKF